jgi:hypothetical protein
MSIEQQGVKAMKQHSIGRTLCVLLITVVGTGRGLCDEAAGLVADDGFGVFSLDDNGTVRQFNQSVAKSQYSPTRWRPGRGGRDQSDFASAHSGRGKTLRAVGRQEQVEVGVQHNGESPEPTGNGRRGRWCTTGVRAKVASGHIAGSVSAGTRSDCRQDGSLLLVRKPESLSRLKQIGSLAGYSILSIRKKI